MILRIQLWSWVLIGVMTLFNDWMASNHFIFFSLFSYIFFYSKKWNYCATEFRLNGAIVMERTSSTEIIGLNLYMLYIQFSYIFNGFIIVQCSFWMGLLYKNVHLDENRIFVFSFYNFCSSISLFLEMELLPFSVQFECGDCIGT